MGKKHIVTIDGAAGTGKSTAAGRLAERLGWLYVNSGYIFRAETLLAIKAGLLDRTDLAPETVEEKLVEIIQKTKFDFKENHGEAARLFLNGEDVTVLLKSPEVDTRVSPVAQLMDVRAETVKIQHAEAERSSIVVEGRDTGTVVFPDADVKFFLTASIDVQVDRQMKVRAEQGEKTITREELRKQIEERDTRDWQKHLRKPADAIEVNTDKINADQVVDLLEKTVREKLKL